MPCSHLLHIHTWTLTIVVEVLLAGNPVCRFPMFTNTRVYRTTMLVHHRNRLLERNERPTFVSLDEKMIDFPTNNIRNDVRSHVWWLKSTRERGGAGGEKGKGAIRSSLRAERAFSKAGRNEDSGPCKASRLFAYPRRENWTNSYSTSHPNAEKFTER